MKSEPRAGEAAVVDRLVKEVTDLVRSHGRPNLTERQFLLELLCQMKYDLSPDLTLRRERRVRRFPKDQELRRVAVGEYWSEALRAAGIGENFAISDEEAAAMAQHSENDLKVRFDDLRAKNLPGYKLLKAMLQSTTSFEAVLALLR